MLTNGNHGSDIAVALTAPNGRNYIQPIGLFVNNEFVKSSNGQKLETIYPVDGSVTTSVYAATVDDVDTAVAAARKAFNDPSWRDLPPSERGNLLLKLADLVGAHRETLATIEAWDTGKTYTTALNDDMAGAESVLRYYGGYADKIHGQVMDTGPQKHSYTVKEPIGVCGQIIPWNFPLMMAAWKLGPALACGNTVVLKAAEQTPLSVLYLAGLIKEAGFPNGVVNILNGYGREAGAAIASHLDVDKIAFTGSTLTGKEIMKMAAINMKNITLETGGKSPLMVFADADIEQAAKWAHRGIFSNQGQVCSATSRILVQEEIYDKFVIFLKQQVEDISVVGNPFEQSTFQGPQVSEIQYRRVLDYMKSGQEEGATLTMGGEAFTTASSKKGFFIKPTIFTNVKPDMKIYREEIFGPCVVVVPFTTEEQALQMANDSIYGLSSAVFTSDIVKGLRLARRIEAGVVCINGANLGATNVPFGGVKQSGIGRELGEAGLASYYNLKSVHVNLGSKL